MLIGDSNFNLHNLTPAPAAPAEPIGHERRYLPRWDVENKILYRKKTDIFYQEAHTKDFNCAGLCLSSGEPIPENQEVSITLYLSEDVTLNIKGVTSWQKKTEQGYLAGIQFDHISKKAQNLLLEFAFENHQQEVQKRWFDGWAGR